MRIKKNTVGLGVNGRRRTQSGSAVILMLAMLGILMIFFSVEIATLRGFRREVKLINQRQLRRWERVRTNSPTSAEKPVKPAVASPNHD